MAVLQLLESLMGRETDYIERTIDTHIDQLEDLGVI
jgi:DNA-binding response OmpR family regulator